jgi:bifunctional non-homologous end joining protein LigD
VTDTDCSPCFEIVCWLCQAGNTNAGAEPPSGEEWIHEIKHDGHRTLIVIDQGKVRAYSRPGRDWTGLYRRVVDAAGKLSCRAALLDGEIIVQDQQGISDFEALRSAIRKAPHRLVFFAFDLLHLDGHDLRRTPLIERRAALRGLIEPDPRSPIQFSDHVDCDGAKFFKAAAELGLGHRVQAGNQPVSRGFLTQVAQDQEERVRSPRHRD